MTDKNRGKEGSGGIIYKVTCVRVQPSFKPRVIMKDISNQEIFGIMLVSDLLHTSDGCCSHRCTQKQTILCHIGDTVYHQKLVS